MLKLRHLDNFIVLLMFALLPVDMVNGILLKNNINLPISIGQFYKFFIISFLFCRFLFTLRLLLLSLLVSLLLLTPSIYQLTIDFDKTPLFSELIKISKYLTPFFCFLFFVELIKNRKEYAYSKLMQLVRFSYRVLVINIFIKYLGLGYPAYEHGNIGSKGFFYAGNELSALLIVLSAILGFKMWTLEKKKKYYLFLVLNLLAGLTISSKTAILGIILVFFTIPFLDKSFNIKKFAALTVSILLFLPLVFFASWKFIENSALILRIRFFYDKLDFWTFVLSGRNTFFENSYKTYSENYSLLEKIIGVGRAKYELLNNNKIVEMDIIDIFFSYGVLGILIFVAMFVFLILQSKRFINTSNYPYSRLVLLMIIILMIISTIAGHVFGAGMSAIFIGLLFSLMYFKRSV